ncbi:M55 family metallopeptidase [Roseovarius sp. SCSIO 43702]|uniref:M55 family metallopeptidase n=1 Tax=Roseovarius sp. SCSIO 43702 TaxID=2823043 RepID=UPI001C735BDC|nr:M55 family metallopeptidase [Roseovarius sp. SCSIO 43702]QYX56791.1 M55 family metallopeptidase [Roseovarius sp. SCSIO 43702]
MKVMISVDIEGIAGIAHWDEALKPRDEYPAFRDLMTDEAIAACQGARAAGATEIFLRDAHQTARNLDISRLPEGVRVIRGWSGHPFKMLQELDESFDAVAMVGWHGAARDGGNPLSHTMTGRFADITLNDEPLSEYGLHARLAASVGVPVVFLSGDAAICAEARGINPAINTVETKVGRGASVVTLVPRDACARIEAGVASALATPRTDHAMPVAQAHRLDLRFPHHELAYQKSFYPGARLVAPDTIRVEADTIFEIARALCFM